MRKNLLFIFLLLLIKLVYFQYACLFTDSFGHRLLEMLLLMLPKISVSIFILCVLLCLGRYGGLVLLVSLDMWLGANMIYYTCNALFVDVPAMMMIGNLTDLGTANAIIPHLKDLCVLPLSSFFIFKLMPSAKEEMENKRKFLFVMGGGKMLKISIMLLVSAMLQLSVYANTWRNNYYNNSIARKTGNDLFIERWGEGGYKSFIPFHYISLYATGYAVPSEGHWQDDYIKKYSIAHYLPAMLIYHYIIHRSEDIVVDADEVAPFIIEHAEDSLKPEFNLIVLLVESLESWPIDAKGQLAGVAPNLTRFCHMDHVAYYNKVKTQVQHGVSGDGQMIINSGLLPIKDGAACNMFGDNTYPGFARFFSTSSIINPWPGYWNQTVMAEHYGYQQLIEPEIGKWRDDDVIDHLISFLDSVPQQPFCAMAITVSMHKPFDVQQRINNVFDNSVPDVVSDYLNCLTYTDGCIGRFLPYFDNTDYKSNTIIVITGDHTVFKKGAMKDLTQITDIDKTLITDHYSYCPLLIYSPQINHNLTDDREYFQMDIYPTILHGLGLNAYFWQGFGCNMLNGDIQRQISERQAFDLSDRMIRSNFFSTYTLQEH